MKDYYKRKALKSLSAYFQRRWEEILEEQYLKELQKPAPTEERPII